MASYHALINQSMKLCSSAVLALSPQNLVLGNRINDDSRKGAKDAKFGEIGKFFFFSLRSWRLGVKIFVEVVL
jgi:hypothetical protein